MSGTDSSTFVISRRFAAPREVVWRAWTQEAELKRWFGPKGCTMPVASMDFRVGGRFHYGLDMGGQRIWGLWRFQEIVAPERMVLLQSFSDETGGITRHPWDARWPLETHSVTSFEEQDGGTVVTLRWSPHEASEEARAVFLAGFESMRGGWGGTMDRFDEYLAGQR